MIVLFALVINIIPLGGGHNYFYHLWQNSSSIIINIAQYFGYYIAASAASVQTGSQNAIVTCHCYCARDGLYT